VEHLKYILLWLALSLLTNIKMSGTNAPAYLDRFKVKNIYVLKHRVSSSLIHQIKKAWKGLSGTNTPACWAQFNLQRKRFNSIGPWLLDRSRTLSETKFVGPSISKSSISFQLSSISRLLSMTSCYLPCFVLP